MVAGLDELGHVALVSEGENCFFPSDQGVPRIMESTSIEFNLRPRGPSEAAALCAELEKFSWLLARHGYQTLAYNPSAVKHFESLPETQRSAILRQFRQYASLCEAVEDAQVSFRSGPDLARYVVSGLGLNGPKSFFELLGSEDIVEVYNSDGVQIFRNFVFYEHCSYTLLEIISYPWYELLERHEAVTREIGEHIGRVLGECNDVIPSTVRAHTMREIFSEEKRMFISQFDRFAPLFAGPGQKAGFICSGKLSYVPHEPDSLTFLTSRA
jgi:hypothetical protein